MRDLTFGPTQQAQTLLRLELLLSISMFELMHRMPFGITNNDETIASDLRDARSSADSLDLEARDDVRIDMASY